MAFIAPTGLPLHTTARQICRQKGFIKATLPQPLFDRILVRRDSAPSTSKSGLILTGGASESTNTGVVLKTGAGRRSAQGALEDMPVEEGDRILWKDEYGSETVDQEQDLIMLRAFSVVAKL